MALKQILSILFIVVTTSQALPVQRLKEIVENGTSTNYRLPTDTVPIHYNIKLIPHIVEDDFTFDGEVSVDLEVLKPTSDITLHSNNLTLEDDIVLKSSNGDTRQAESYNYDNETNISIIHFGEELKPGMYNLNMKYKGYLSDDLLGFYRTSYVDDDGNTAWIAVTQFQPTSARRAFPCWDEPALKATFNISIKHNTNYTAISNMPIYEQSAVDEADGKVWTHFETTPIMSTYLVAFTVGDYMNISNADNTINVWCRKGLIPHAKFVHELAQNAAEELEKYTNSSVRVPKMDHVAVPEHAAGAMENWGMITYPEQIFGPIEDKSMYELSRTVITVIHELTHQWFGNLVSPSWWSHIWLNEGFASYFEHYIIDKLFENWRAGDYFTVHTVQRYLANDVPAHMKEVDANATTLNEIDSAFSMSVYGKAPSLLHMLSNMVSEKVFHTGLVRYLDKYQYNSTSPDSLWAAMQNALDESDVPHNDFNVKEVMDTWIKQKRYPLITVNRDYSTGETKVTQEDFGLVQSHEHYGSEQYDDDEGTNMWWIPINYVTGSDPDFSDTLPTQWLKPQENLTIKGIDADDWVIFNKQETGFYRVNYDDTNWKRIASYLHSENFKNIHVLNRAQIVDDAYNLMRAGRLSRSIFLDVIGYLAQETDHIPWFPAFAFMFEMGNMFLLPQAKPARDWALNLMDNLIKHVGYEERPDDDPATIFSRMSIFDYACTLNHPGCRKAAADHLKKFLYDSDEHRISPHLKYSFFCFGLQESEVSVWDTVYDLYTDTDSDELLCHLSCTKNSTIIAKYIDLAFNDTLITKDQRRMMLSCLLDDLASVDLILDYFFTNPETFSASLNDLAPFIGSVARRADTEEQFDKLKEFYKIIGMDEEHMQQLEKRRNKLKESISVLQQWLELF